MASSVNCCLTLKLKNICLEQPADLDRTAGDQLLVPGNQCIVQLNGGEAGAGAVDSEAIIQDYDYEGQIVSAFVQSLGMR